MNAIKNVFLHVIPFGMDFYRCFKYGEYGQMTYWEYLCYRLGFSRTYYPVHKTCIIGNPRKIYVGKNSYIGRPFSYIQGAGGIYIGNYVRFTPNVSVLSSNHDLYDHRKSVRKPIIIGDYCWIGTQSVILAGVTLGPRTIVAANSTVTKSFPQGYCVIGGCPAKVIKELDPAEVVKFKAEKEYYGFIPAEEFERKKSKYIDADNEQTLKELSHQLSTPTSVVRAFSAVTDELRQNGGGSFVLARCA